MYIPGLDAGGSYTRGSHAMQMGGVAVEFGLNVNVDEDLGRNGSVGNKVVQPPNKRKLASMTSTDPAAISSG